MVAISHEVEDLVLSSSIKTPMLCEEFLRNLLLSFYTCFMEESGNWWRRTSHPTYTQHS